MTQVTTRPIPAIHSLAGDLALNDSRLRETLHARHILTVGIPHTIEPLSPTPPPEVIHQLLTVASLSRKRTPRQVQLAVPPATAVRWSKVSLPAC